MKQFSLHDHFYRIQARLSAIEKKHYDVNIFETPLFLLNIFYCIADSRFHEFSRKSDA